MKKTNLLMGGLALLGLGAMVTFNNPKVTTYESVVSKVDYMAPVSHDIYLVNTTDNYKVPVTYDNTTYGKVNLLENSANANLKLKDGTGYTAFIAYDGGDSKTYFHTYAVSTTNGKGFGGITYKGYVNDAKEYVVDENYLLDTSKITADGVYTMAYEMNFTYNNELTCPESHTCKVEVYLMSTDQLGTNEKATYVKIGEKDLANFSVSTTVTASSIPALYLETHYYDKDGKDVTPDYTDSENDNGVIIKKAVDPTEEEKKNNEENPKTGAFTNLIEFTGLGIVGLLLLKACGKSKKVRKI